MSCPGYCQCPDLKIGKTSNTDRKTVWHLLVYLIKRSKALLKSLSAIFVFFVTAPAFADACSDVQCPQGRKTVNLCLSGNAGDTLDSAIMDLGGLARCGVSAERYSVNKTSDLIKTLAQLARQCKTVKNATFIGHGDPGFHNAGNLDYKKTQFDSLKPYSCLFAPNAAIALYGCNVGEGCSGDILLFKVASTLLPKGGKVTAPTDVALMAGFGSANGQERELVYTPNESTAQHWSMNGNLSNKSGPDQCSEKLSEAFSDYDKAKNDAQKKGCSLSQSRLSSSDEDAYRQLQKNLLESDFWHNSTSSTWTDVTAKIYGLMRKTAVIEGCSAPATIVDSQTDEGAK
jgi:hypothetical protein